MDAAVLKLCPRPASSEYHIVRLSRPLVVADAIDLENFAIKLGRIGIGGTEITAVSFTDSEPERRNQSRRDLRLKSSWHGRKISQSSLLKNLRICIERTKRRYKT